MSNGSNTNSCMAHAFYSGIYLYGLSQWAHRYDTETHMGLLTLSKNISQLALFLSLYHISSRSESRPNKAIVMIFAAHFLFFFVFFWMEGLHSC